AGLDDPDFYSDWRACIIAVGADGKRRYSPLWNLETMTLKRVPGDMSYWLAVSATPTAIYSDVEGGRGIVQAVYSGRYAYRYPWFVRLTGARPGTPRECRADFGDVALECKLDDSVPAPHDTPEGKAFLGKLKAFAKTLDDDGLKSQIQAEIDRMTKGRRHPNGGGWVAETAQVAATAYVGRDAMVLGNAKALDHAIVEDFAIVTDKAVVSDHARISGQGIVKGDAKAGGYARVWHTLDKGEATVVPMRLGAKALHKHGLWANYAMDREEKTILGDWYRFAHGADKRYGKRLGVNLDGWLRGTPTFVVDGSRRGFRFGGEGWAAQLNARACDLGEMTLDIALKWEGWGSQGILNIGDCLVLRTDRSGKPEVVATVGGKVVARATSGKALSGAWVRIRIECDGKALSLWVNGKRVASQATSFRPCDAFPPGQPKVSTLALADGSDYFKGVIDYIVIYHTVHDDFDKLPPPTRDAPTRPTKEFIASIEKAYGNLAVVNEKVKQGVEERNKPFEKLRLQKDARYRQLLERSPAFLKAEATLEAAQKTVDARKGQLAAEFGKTPDTAAMQAKIDAMKKQVSDLNAVVRKLETESYASDEELKALTAKRKAADTQRRDLEKKLRQNAEKDPKVAAKRKTLAELREKMDTLKPAVQKLEKQAKDGDAALTALYARRKTDKTANKKIRDREKIVREKLGKANADVRAYDELSAKYWHINNNELRKALDAVRRKDPAFARLVEDVRKLDTAMR
ncbi:hypothetical protein HQ560_18665, partial [bacterium]|nr:hypothetical protein [bacterium]